MRATATIVLALAVLSAAGPAAAQDLDEAQRLRRLAVQDRHHHHWHELTVSVGFLPVDAFLKGFAVSGNYTLHFTPVIAWEIVHAYGVLATIEMDLNDDLNNVGIPNPFSYVNWAATSSLVFTPFYGKYAIFNRTQIFAELFLLAGAGYGWLTNATRDSDANTQHAVADVGLGFRVFFGEYFSVRFDLRWEGFFLNVEEPHHELWIALGVSVHLG